MRSLVLQVHQAARLFDRMLDPVLAELGLNVSELPILIAAAGRGRTTVAQLRDWFGYPGATASVAVRRLDAQQYVRVRHDAPDARLLAIYATRPGAWQPKSRSPGSARSRTGSAVERDRRPSTNASTCWTLLAGSNCHDR